MLKRTPLYDQHVAAGARMVDFGGWEMPLHYGSQIQEHDAVRHACGVFDVSHMRAVDLSGADALAFLRLLLANDCGRLAPGKALYSCMLDETGGVIDDLIAYRVDAGAWSHRLVVNAGTAEDDLEWMRACAAGRGFDARLDERADLAMLAVQGPQARALVAQAVPEWSTIVGELPVFAGAVVGEDFIARTGYTGEDGCEIAVPAGRAAWLWETLVAHGATPCGLGARDTLRLEAGMALYGHEMDRSVTPLESGLAWTVDFKAGRDFIGRAALEAQRERGNLRQLLGLKLLDRGVLRAGQEVTTPLGSGITTSGSFAPSMGTAIALARLPAGVMAGDIVTVDLRGRAAAAQVCRPPFVRHGKVLV